jgi:16S rRNA (guanine527-N7)-methyltransferase
MEIPATRNIEGIRLMSRTSQSELAVLLKGGAESLDCPLNDLQLNQFLTYLEELKVWNRAVNLTAIVGDEEIVEKHFLDSIAGLKAIEEHPGQSLIDIGTGAGFPGLPLKIASPKLRLFLVESSQKKAAFLHHLTGKLRLSEVHIFNQRVESLLKSGNHYDLIVTRAFAKTQVVLEKALPLLAPEGKLILYQGGMPSQAPVRDLKGWERTIRYELPFSKIQRRLEIFRRIS